MIAETPNICITNYHIPNLRPLRALFLILLFLLRSPGHVNAQSFNVDTLISQLDTGHYNDSTRIHLMHRISYLLLVGGEGARVVSVRLRQFAGKYVRAEH